MRVWMFSTLPKELFLEVCRACAPGFVLAQNRPKHSGPFKCLCLAQQVKESVPLVFVFSWRL